MGFLENCHYGKLSSEIICKCQPFSSENDEGISSFFHDGNPDNYADYQHELMAISHCFYTKEERPRMVCAFSLSNTALRVDVLPRSYRNRFNRKQNIPNNKRRAQYPAILIGQLCIFDGFGRNALRNEDVGKELMNLIKAIAIDPENSVAARYLVVDATNNEQVLNYYKRNGFTFLFSDESEEYENLNDRRIGYVIPPCVQKLFIKKRLNEDNRLKTRLMLFDLIVLNPGKPA